MFFARSGIYEPCGIFTLNHIKLLIITVLLIIVALKNTVNKNKEQVKNIVKTTTIGIWILETVRIIFSIKNEGINNVNTYLPLYYCSLLLYAGMFSSFFKGKLKRAGDVFLATGGIVGGAIFMILPTTSLTVYPVFHFISIHSFIFHGTMVYLGILINKTKYIELEKRDIIYYLILVGCVCVIACIINSIFNSNLMFISDRSTISIIQWIYDFAGPLFTLVISICQMTLPFYFIYGNIRLYKNAKIKDEMEQRLVKENIY